MSKKPSSRPKKASGREIRTKEPKIPKKLGSIRKRLRLNLEDVHKLQNNTGVLLSSKGIECASGMIHGLFSSKGRPKTNKNKKEPSKIFRKKSAKNSFIYKSQNTQSNSLIGCLANRKKSRSNSRKKSQKLTQAGKTLKLKIKDGNFLKSLKLHCKSKLTKAKGSKKQGSSRNPNPKRSIDRLPKLSLEKGLLKKVADKLVASGSTRIPTTSRLNSHKRTPGSYQDTDIKCKSSSQMRTLPADSNPLPRNAKKYVRNLSKSIAIKRGNIISGNIGKEHFQTKGYYIPRSLSRNGYRKHKSFAYSEEMSQAQTKNSINPSIFLKKGNSRGKSSLKKCTGRRKSRAKPRKKSGIHSIKESRRLSQTYCR